MTYYTDYFNDDNWFLDKTVFESNSWKANNSWNVFFYYNFTLSTKLVGIPTKYQNSKLDSIFIANLKSLAQQQVTTLITLYPSQEAIFNYLNLGDPFVNSSAYTHKDLDLDVVKQNVNPEPITRYQDAFSVNLSGDSTGVISNNLSVQDGVKDYKLKEEVNRHDDGLVRDSLTYKSDFTEEVNRLVDELIELAKPTYFNGGNWKWKKGYGQW